MQNKLNKIYSANQFFYFSLYGAMFAFISVFLLGKGFDNATIGTVLAIIGLASIGIQTLLSNFLDQHKNIELQDVLSLISIIISIGSLILYFMENRSWLLFLVILTLSLGQAIMGLVNSLAFIYEPFGIRINYGLGRGMGSLAYAVVTMLLGYIIEETTSNLIPLSYVLFALLLLLSVRFYFLPKEEQNIVEKSDEPLAEKLASDKSIFEFFQKYKRLTFLMSGIVFLFSTHTLINNFFIQLITPIGGTNRLMGIAIFIATIVELPAMMNLNRLVKVIPLDRLIKLSAAFFVAKHALTFLATNMAMIYLAQFLQIGAFSVAFPALVEYVNSVVSIQDLVKGQSLLTGAIALSSVFASFFGGILLDHIGTRLTLFIGLMSTLVGLIIVFIAVEGTPQEPVQPSNNQR